MPAPSALFYGLLSFLLGVLFASLGLTLEVVYIAAAIAAAFVVLGFTAYRSTFVHQFAARSLVKKFDARQVRRHCVVLAALTPLILAGSLYYHWDEVKFRAVAVPLGTQTISGIVRDDPALREGYRPATVEVTGSSGARIRANLLPYPEVRYGDVVRLTGRVALPSPERYAQYLAKERVGGVMQRPAIEITSRGAGSPFQAVLYAMKRRVTEVFARVLPAEDASFLSGLTVGERGEFSQELKYAMQRSGTTHLVALSGYNITILAEAIMGAALWCLRRRWALFTTLLVIVGFTCMAGAEASVVRAAIMGSLALAAKETGRLFDVRQAIVLAGVVMVFLNPKVLAFDVGFQLSFLALLGIVYLEPALRRLTAPHGNAGMLGWRTTLSATAAAQLAVAPLLIAQFGTVSLTSLAANLLILAAIPVTMGVGFTIAAAGAVSTLLAQVVGLVAWVLTRYELSMIQLWSALAVPVTSAVSWVGAALYYAALVGFAVWAIHIHAHPREV